MQVLQEQKPAFGTLKQTAKGLLFNEKQLQEQLDLFRCPLCQDSCRAYFLTNLGMEGRWESA